MITNGDTNQIKNNKRNKIFVSRNNRGKDHRKRWIKFLEKNNLKSNDISYLVPHQANKRIIDATAKKMGIGDKKVLMNIEKYC